mgnify:CR=1 FL=1
MQKKKLKIKDRHKYTDMLTSLKNRNYLNAKMNEWEDCKVFPQSIVMVDLNNVKYVNDNYGHEEGDQLIIKAASILVNTQLENTEIIRIRIVSNIPQPYIYTFFCKVNILIYISKVKNKKSPTYSYCKEIYIIFA